MSDFLLDKTTGDISIVDEDLVLIATVEDLVRQQVLITLRAFRGEWKFNINYGVPYVSNDNNPDQILGKVNKATFDLAIREAILSVDGISGIQSYNSALDFTSQIMSVTFVATTNSGAPTEEIILEI